MSGSAAYRGVLRLAAPLVPFFLYAFMWAAFDSTSDDLGALVLFVGMVGVVVLAAVVGWRRQDAVAARLGRLDRVWAFQRAVRTGRLPGEGVGDEGRWRAETLRQLHSTETEVAGARWLWLVGLVLAVPVAAAWAAGWESWATPAFVPAALMVGWPVVWDAVRRRNRLRGLASQLD